MSKILHKDTQRRDFLKTLIASSFIPVVGISSAKANEIESLTKVNIILSKKFRPEISSADRYKLVNSTLNFIQEHYNGKKLPAWGKRYEEINLEKRLNNIVYWISQGIQKYRDIYPIDPVWLVAQMMIESFFYEFAISSSLAVGVCQFIKPTANEYNMVCAGDLPEHSKYPYNNPEYANDINNYYQIIKDKRKFKKVHSNNQLSLKECLQIIAENKCQENLVRAKQNLIYEQELDIFDNKITESKKRYKEFIQSNIKNKDLFADTNYLHKLDERLTYRKSIPAMVKMIAKNLSARNGNILAATAGYHAGLSRTFDNGLSKTYGKIPNIQSTVDYLSNIIVVHTEIKNRINNS